MKFSVSYEGHSQNIIVGKEKGFSLLECNRPVFGRHVRTFRRNLLHPLSDAFRRDNDGFSEPLVPVYKTSLIHIPADHLFNYSSQMHTPFHGFALLYIPLHSLLFIDLLSCHF